MESINTCIVDTSATSCKKAVHLHKDVRTAEARKRFVYNSAVHLTFRGEEQFLPNWETSSLLELFMPKGSKYMQLTVAAGSEEETADNVRWFESIARGGYRTKQSLFRILFADWDDDGSAILVDAAGTIKTIADLGLHAVLCNDNDGAKLRKRMKRIFAHHEWAIKGRTVDTGTTRFGKKVIVDVAGHQFETLHVELEPGNALGSDEKVCEMAGIDVSNFMLNNALADGIAIIDEELCNTLGRLLNNADLMSMREGDAFKGTCLDTFGLGKGFFHVMKNCKFGIVLFGTKREVWFDHFFLGSLGDVKAGAAYTDLQSMLNFDYWKDDMVYNRTVEFAKEVQIAMEDEQKMRHLFLSHIAPIAEVLGDEAAGGRETWVLIDALRKGVSLRKNPGLMRRVRRHMLTHVLNTSKGRVPFGEIGARFNLQPDLDCFRNADGVVDGSVDWTRSSVPTDSVCSMDQEEGPLSMFRQPSGHKLERVITTNVHSRRFRRFRGRNRIILGAMAWLYLRIMGGGDMDDSVIALIASAWVNQIASTTYPFTELPQAAQKAEVKENKYRKVRNVYPRPWNISDFMKALSFAMEVALNIGVVVNAVMWDVLLSGEHKEHMLTVLADRIADEGAGKCVLEKDGTVYTLGEVYDWLRNREDNLLRGVASNLEAFIDYVKMGKGDPLALEPLVALIQDVRQNSLIVPALFLINMGTEDKPRLRVPGGRLANQDYIVLPSMVCNELARIQNEIKQLEEALTEEEWFNVDTIPATLDAVFPRDNGLRGEAIELRESWREFFSNRKGELKDAYRTAVDTIVRPAVRGGLFAQEDGISLEEIEMFRAHFAVEHARLTYRGRKDRCERNADGTARSYPDGLLWTNTLGAYYIKALELAGLTGEYVPVMFDRHSTKYSHGTHAVSVRAGVVFHTDDNALLGTTRGGFIEDGSFTMQDGMICIQEPSVELSEDRAVVNEDTFAGFGDEYGELSDEEFLASL